ncbi:PBP1A family penicillin-binding protein [Mycoplasmatota bacterium]|nr:PBP1A family penicillin-binding protein [Mycoplasmatota bacterium]
MNKKYFFSVLKTIAILIVLGMISVLGYTYLKVNKIIEALPSLDINQIYVEESTKVYDQNHRLIVELGVKKRDVISYEEISENMVHALTSIEDERFFSHQGIDYKRVLAALVENIKSYRYKEGASTITQQLVKLSFLSNEKTLDRKIKEMFISVELENRLSKEKIIEAYLNRVLFGGRIYGVEKASKYYFNKQAKDLNYEEAALLAGMVQSPNRYNPYINPDITKNRQIIVLYALFNNHYISKDELDKAIKKPITDLVVEQTSHPEDEKYYEYIDQVIFELKNKYHLDPFNDSLKIFTYLDPSIQNKIYEIENDESLHPNEKTQTGIVILETATGIIRGIGGGRNYRGSLSFNYATDARRQPGSTIKPILDYGPAIEYLHYSPAHPYLDEKIYYNTIGSRFVAVENYDKKYKGYLTMREAIIDSRNVTAIKAFREVGSKKAYEFANKLGISTDETITEAHALGGYQYGFTVLQMAAAYAPFGNGGTYNEPTTIDYIIKDNETIKYQRTSHVAMREDTAYLMTHILHDNMMTGTATKANVSDLNIAGKTGQTNYNEETRKNYDFPSNSVRDSWFIGYTTKYTTAVWLGYDKIEESTYLTPTEAKLSLEMFKRLMDKVHINRNDSKAFVRPDNIIEVEIESHTYPLSLPNEYTPNMYKIKDLFIKGTEPTIKSHQFKPLEMPKNFIVYYDDQASKLVFKWKKYGTDYSRDDFKLMEKIHSIENYYDYHKNKTQREFYKANDNFHPSFLSLEKIQNIYNDYCQSEDKITALCPIYNKQSLNNYISLLEALKKYEISLILRDKDINILSEGEISILRGYRVWNGYRNGLYSNLGSIEYQIIGHIGFQKEVLYQGPYEEEISLLMSLDNFLHYDSFSIQADYSIYKNRLKSDSNISINPLFSINSIF